MAILLDLQCDAALLGTQGTLGLSALDTTAVECSTRSEMELSVPRGVVVTGADIFWLRVKQYEDFFDRL